MAIDTITPAATSLVEPGDSFSFTVDDTYAAMTIEVETSGGWEYAYDGTLGGAQAGYTVSVTVSGGRHIFVVTRDAGWDLSPTSIRVIEDETGASATTTTNYVLATATSYPQTSTPYYINPSMTNAKFTDLLDTPASYSGEALKVYRVNAAETALEAVTPASGTGDVVGPASAVDERIAVFDGTTGKLIKDGGATVASLGAGSQHRQWTGYFSGLGNVTWETWDQFDGVDDVDWTTNAGVVGSDPTLNFLWNNPHFTKAATLSKVRIYAHAGSTSDVEYEIWRWTTTDSMTSTPAGVLVASGTDSVISNRTHIIDLTIADASIPENSAVQFFAKKNSGGAMSLKVTIDLEWTE